MDRKMGRCEDEKIIYRPPLLEEPFAQSLSGKIPMSKAAPHVGRRYESSGRHDAYTGHGFGTNAEWHLEAQEAGWQRGSRAPRDGDLTFWGTNALEELGIFHDLIQSNLILTNIKSYLSVHERLHQKRMFVFMASACTVWGNGQRI